MNIKHTDWCIKVMYFFLNYNNNERDYKQTDLSLILV